MIPDCFVLTDREKALPFKMGRKVNDLRVGKYVYEVPEDYWCSGCDGTGCNRCKDTGIALKKNRKLWKQKIER